MDILTHHADIDLIGDGIDIAIRMGEPWEGDLIHRRMGAVRPRLFAASSLLAGNLILSPADLVGMPFVTHRRRLLRGRLHWELEHDGMSITLDHRPTVVVDDPSLARAMVMQGLGIGLLTDADVLGADLAPILPQWAAPPIPIYYVLHPKQRNLPKIRAGLAQL